MKLFEVLPEEEQRVDLFLTRAVGSYTPEMEVFFWVFNPDVNPVRFRSGDIVRVPSQTEREAIHSPRNTLLVSLGM